MAARWHWRIKRGLLWGEAMARCWVKAGQVASSLDFSELHARDGIRAKVKMQETLAQATHD
jgi:hypothetical protein